VKKIAVLLMVGLVGCYAAPPLVEFKDEFTTGADFNKTWAAVVDVLSAHNFPVESIERESGLVTTDWVSLGYGTKTCSCPGSILAVFSNHRMKVSVFVKVAGEGTSFRIRCHFEGFDSNIMKQWTTCNSLGVTEKTLSENILKVAGS
jgi:hypothetical protein